MADSPSVIRDALRRGDFPIAVYGLGKIGLPVAVAFAAETGRVTGVDIDPDLVRTIASGSPPFTHEPGLEAELSRVIEHEDLTVTSDGRSAAAAAAIHIIVVPVPVSDEQTADLTALKAAVDTIANGIAPGDIIILETTVPPGTCAELIEPRVIDQSGVPSSEIGVASCPERTSSGQALADIRGSYPRIVGGVTNEATDAAVGIYSAIVENEIIPVSDARTAEAVKLFEGAYRDVNIALANELAVMFQDEAFDVREAIDAANTQPYCSIHDPGAGVGGHCIPYYPYFLLEASTNGGSLLTTAREVNDTMPRLVAERTIGALESHGIAPQDARVGVLGYSYRPAIPEVAATPARPLIEQLRAAGVSVQVVDPVLDDIEIDLPLTPLDSLIENPPDAITLVTAHDEFLTVDWRTIDVPVIVDGRDALPENQAPTVVIGRGEYE